MYENYIVLTSLFKFKNFKVTKGTKIRVLETSTGELQRTYMTILRLFIVKLKQTHRDNSWSSANTQIKFKKFYKRNK